ncbi:DUF58 domain-containing protein [Engelhardtia mirabilis]|uniref:DUF58 domain-containing protein n=1 Tax=Engelhardtia mirabilis TaxID=2528011 RepID=A0A518BIM8_9BACT|nr:hypothetical protein Pla133_18790 [Planctomycetes bacterium Pla133]QDV01129.1 hypothetical protein Pla86_18780 [Planctomycetes bacterium Pla86]
MAAALEPGQRLRPGLAARALLDAWRLVPPQKPVGRLPGSELASGVGASLEMQDRRSYAPGDDVRRLDWGAFARTDQLMVRQYREEVAPKLELLLDVSASMGVDADKAQLAVDLAALFCGLARSAGAPAQLVLLGDQLTLSEPEALDHGVAFESERPVSELLSDAAAHARPTAQRVLVSDLLSEVDASGATRSLAGRTERLSILQVLSPSEVEPEASGPSRLVDAEGGSSLDVIVDRGAIEAYRRRLERLQQSWRESSQRIGGRFLSLTCGPPLTSLCRERLAVEGWLEPR